MYQSNQSLKIPPPGHTPGILTSFDAREGGNLMNLVFPGAGHLITTHRGWGIWSLASISYYVALIPRGVINHSGDKPWCVQSERYPIRGGLAEKQRLAQALLCIWRYSRTICITIHVCVVYKPCLHTQLPELLKSFPGGGGIWSTEMDLHCIMGYLNSFSASGGGNLNKNVQKIQMPGGLPGGDCWSFDLTGTLRWNHQANELQLPPSLKPVKTLSQMTPTWK